MIYFVKCNVPEYDAILPMISYYDSPTNIKELFGKTCNDMIKDEYQTINKKGTFNTWKEVANYFKDVLKNITNIKNNIKDINKNENYNFEECLYSHENEIYSIQKKLNILNQNISNIFNCFMHEICIDLPYKKYFWNPSLNRYIFSDYFRNKDGLLNKLSQLYMDNNNPFKTGKCDIVYIIKTSNYNHVRLSCFIQHSNRLQKGLEIFKIENSFNNFLDYSRDYIPININNLDNQLNIINKDDINNTKINKKHKIILNTILTEFIKMIRDMELNMILDNKDMSFEQCIVDVKVYYKVNKIFNQIKNKLKSNLFSKKYPKNYKKILNGLRLYWCDIFYRFYVKFDKTLMNNINKQILKFGIENNAFWKQNTIKCQKILTNEFDIDSNVKLYKMIHEFMRIYFDRIPDNIPTKNGLYYINTINNIIVPTYVKLFCDEFNPKPNTCDNYESCMKKLYDISNEKYNIFGMKNKDKQDL